LISLSPKETPKLLQVFQKKKIPVVVIGRIKPEDFGYKIEVNGKIKELPKFKVDEITKIY